MPFRTIIFLWLIATKSFYFQVLNIDRCECEAPLCALMPLAFGRRPLYESAQCISCWMPWGLYIRLLPCECPSPSPVACSHQRQKHDNMGELTQQPWPCCHSHMGAHGTSWPMWMAIVCCGNVLLVHWQIVGFVYFNLMESIYKKWRGNTKSELTCAGIRKGCWER